MTVKLTRRQAQLLRVIEAWQANNVNGDGRVLPAGYSMKTLDALVSAGLAVSAGMLGSAWAKLGWYSVRMIEEAHAEALELNEADDRHQALLRAFWARHRACCARGPFKDTLYGPELVEHDHAEALELDAARDEADQVRARAQASGQNAAAYASHRFCSHEPDGRSLIECDHAEALEDEAVREAAKARHADCPWCKAPHGPSEAEREAAEEAAAEAAEAERERLHSEQLDQAERERPGLLSPGLLDEADEILTAATVYVRHYPARRYRHMGAGI